MAYDETHNYKLSARLKLKTKSAPTRWFAGVLLVVSLLSGGAYFSDSFRSQIYNIYYSTTSEVYRGVNFLNVSISNKIGNFGSYFDLENKYNKLKEKYESLKEREVYYVGVESELSALKKALKYDSNNPQKILMTEILMQSASGYVEAARVPVGSVNGVKKGDVVVDGEKLIGRITDVGERFSKVVLVTSPNSKVPVVFEETNLKAILRGNYDGKLAVEMIHGEGVMPKLGEMVTASGDGYHFPSGVAIGKVTMAEGSKIEITPFFDVRNIRLVSILRD